MFNIKLTILIFLLFVSGLYTQQNNGKYSIIYAKKVMTIDSTTGEKILLATDVAEDKQGNIYITDKIDASVKKFNRNGKFLGKIGRGIKGFDSIDSPGAISIYNDVLAVADQGKEFIYLIGTNLNYIGKFQTYDIVRDLSFDNNGRLYLGFYKNSTKNMLVLYNINGEPIRYFNEIKSKGNGVWNYFSLAVSIENNIILAYRYFNLIEIYDSLGNMIKKLKISELPDKSESFQYKNIRDFPSSLMIADVCVDEKGRILILNGENLQEAHRKIFIFDKSGNSQIDVLLPSKTGILVSGGKSHVFTRENSRTTVTKYYINF